jgi:hypothetical protein
MSYLLLLGTGSVSLGLGFLLGLALLEQRLGDEDLVLCGDASACISTACSCEGGHTFQLCSSTSRSMPEPELAKEGFGAQTC